MAIHKARIKQYNEISERMKKICDSTGKIYPHKAGQIINVNPLITDVIISIVDHEKCYGVLCTDTDMFINRDLLDIDEAPCPPSD